MQADLKERKSVFEVEYEGIKYMVEYQRDETTGWEHCYVFNLSGELILNKDINQEIAVFVRGLLEL